MHRHVIVLAVATVSLAVADVSAAPTRSDTTLRVGLVEWTGTATGTQLGRQFHGGFVRAVRKLGLEASVREVPPDTDPGEALAHLARQKVDLIVMGAFLPAMAEVVRDVASDYPDSTFLVPDYARPPGSKNVQGFILRVEEASFLAGHLAAQLERRRPGRNVISSVGGEATAPVNRFIAGYQAGARRADPGIKVLNGYSYDFSNPRKCRTVALGQIAAGSGAVFDVAGTCGEGALAAAKAEGVWGIGVDGDYSSLGAHVLTSVLKRYDVALLLELRAFKHGTLPRSGTASFGLRENAVGLGRLNDRVPPAVVELLARTRAQVITGTIRVPVSLR